jgi:hypothetical protein
VPPLRQEAPAEEKEDACLEADIRQVLMLAREDGASSPDAEGGFQWKRLALAAGGLVAAAGLIGALAGSWVRGDEQAQADPAVTRPLSSAKHPNVVAPSATVIPANTLEPQAEPSGHTDAAARRTAPSVASRRLAILPTQEADESQAVAGGAQESPAAEVASDQLATEDSQPAAAEPVAASLPLPATIVARTIERIGFACGHVDSTTAVEGAAPGTFKVTCSSGQTYQAAPVRGRYHFRRWGTH